MNSISQVLEIENPRWAWVHNSQIFNIEILKNMEKFLGVRGLTSYKSLMELAPYEFFWYTLWALNQTDVHVEVRSEWVKMINHQGEHLSMWKSEIRKADLARVYLGVIVSSNWSR